MPSLLSEMALSFSEGLNDSAVLPLVKEEDPFPEHCRPGELVNRPAALLPVRKKAYRAALIQHGRRHAHVGLHGHRVNFSPRMKKSRSESPDGFLF